MNNAAPIRGKFIGQRRDQLGARLLTMLNAIRLSQDYGTDYLFNWFPKGADAPKLDIPSELFSVEFMDQHFVTGTAFDALGEKAEPIWKFMSDSPQKLRAHLEAGGHVVLDEGFEIFAFPWEDVETLRGRFPAFIHQLGFNADVQMLMDQINRAMARSNKDTVAYHIRRGDILNAKPWKHKQWPAKIEPEELYSYHLTKTDPGLALVFSDQRESIAKFQAKHPQVKGIDELVDLGGAAPAQRDLLELYAMSRAGQIIAPPISAFSRAAARLSGQERQCFVDILSQEEMDTAYQHLSARFIDGIDNFVTPSEAAQLFAKLSSRLSEWDRDEDARAIGQSILDAGADNAFMPLLHGINCVYLHDWRSARRYLEAAIAHPDMWRENRIAAGAIKAHVLGAMGKARMAQAEFLRAFWQKPFLPDVMAVGSFMIYRGRLKPAGPLPFDPDLTASLRVPYQWVNTLLMQRKILKRRCFDFSAWVVEWPEFVMDGKAHRMLRNSMALEHLHDKVMNVDGSDTIAGRDSFGALLQARLGDAKGALERHSIRLGEQPDNLIYCKRQAEILTELHRYTEAENLLLKCRDTDPDHAFWHYLLGRHYQVMGRNDDALCALERASALDQSTAMLQAAYAEAARQAKDFKSALGAYERAANLAPHKNKFTNMVEKLRQKVGV